MSKPKSKRRRQRQKTDAELLAEAVARLQGLAASLETRSQPGSIIGERAAALYRVLDAAGTGLNDAVTLLRAFRPDLARSTSLVSEPHALAADLDRVLDHVTTDKATRRPQPGPASYEALRDATDTLHDFLSSTAGPRAFQFAIDVSTSRGYPTNGGETTTPPAPEIDPATGEPLEEVRLTPTEAAANAPDRDALRATVALAKADDITRDIRRLLERLTAYRHDRPTEACSSCGTAIPHGRTRCPAADCQTSTQTRPETCSDCDKAFVPGEKTWHGRCNACRLRKRRRDQHIANTEAIQLQDTVITVTEGSDPVA